MFILDWTKVSYSILQALAGASLIFTVMTRRCVQAGSQMTIEKHNQTEKMGFADMSTLSCMSTVDFTLNKN